MNMKNVVDIACFYDKEDAELHSKLMKHLALMRKDGSITYWHVGEIPVGSDQKQEIGNHLHSADIILLLISSSFTSSDHYESIVKQAMERNETGNTRVIPIYLRSVYWQAPPFANLVSLPSNNQPLTSWRDRDKAFLNIIKGIRGVVQELRGISELSPRARISTSSIRQPLPIIPNALTNRDLSGKTAFLQLILQKPYIPLLLVIIVVSSLFIAYTVTDTGQRSSSTPTSVATDCGNIHDELLCTYSGHEGQDVYGVSWSPNGTRIASGGYDKKVRVWDPATGTTYVSYSKHTEPISSVAWSPDGSRVVSASYDGTVQVWDTTGSPLRTYRGHISTDPVLAVVWSPDGKRIASGSRDGTVQVWDASTGETITAYKGHISSDGERNWVNTIAWSPDGKRIASGSNDKTVQIWDAQTGQTLRVYKEHPGTVSAVAWSPDGKFIASSGGGKVQVWNPDTGNPSFTSAAKAWSIAWSPSGKFIVIGTDDGAVQELDSIRGTPIFTYRSSPVYTVAWSSEGTRIASGSKDGMVRVWRVEQF